MSGIVLETDRLLLRRFTDTELDAALLVRLDSDPEVTRYTGPGFATVEHYRENLRKVWLPQYAEPRRGFFAAIDKDTAHFIGWFLLRRSTLHRYAAEIGWTRESDVELGYRLCRAAWGRGLATEGARELVRLALGDATVTSIVACALVTNVGSIRVMEKVGMRRVREFPLAAFDTTAVKYERPREGAVGKSLLADRVECVVGAHV